MKLEWDTYLELTPGRKRSYNAFKTFRGQIKDSEKSGKDYFLHYGFEVSDKEETRIFIDIMHIREGKYSIRGAFNDLFGKGKIQPYVEKSVSYHGVRMTLEELETQLSLLY